MRKKKLSLNQRRMVIGYLFISPWLIGFIAFYIRSLILTLRFSLSDLTVGTVGGYELSFVGLKNYIYAFRGHGTFKQVLTGSLADVVIDVPLIIFFSLFMAILLNRKFKGRTLVRAIFFLPVILNSEAIQDALRLSIQMMSGGISAGSESMNTAMSSGFDPSYYIDMFNSLGMPNVILDYLLAAVERISDIVTASGVQIVIFIAALQSIPGSLYEVARIEGATGYETFWKVTFPMVMPHIITNIVYTVVDKYARSEVMEMVYTETFTNFEYGLSAAFSLISMVITCALLLVVCRYIQKRTFYYN